MPGPKLPQTGMINTVDNLLASTTGQETHAIVIAAATVDANSPEGPTILRKGLVLTQITASGLHSNHDGTAPGISNGLADETNAMVLRDRIDMGDASKDVAATAYFRGTFHASELIIDDSGNFDFSLVQRLRTQ